MLYWSVDGCSTASKLTGSCDTLPTSTAVIEKLRRLIDGPAASSRSASCAYTSVRLGSWRVMAASMQVQMWARSEGLDSERSAKSHKP